MTTAHSDPDEPIDSSQPVVVPTPQGNFSMRAWSFPDGHELMSATALDDAGQAIDADNPAPLVRIHSECLTGDVFGSLRCDCGPQLHQGLDQISARGGTLIYVKGHEGRGIGLVNKLKAYRLQDDGLDTVDANLALGFQADGRAYRQAARVLRELGITTLRLITNNPAKAEALTELGLVVGSLEPDEISPRKENARYLATKRDRMHHRLVLVPVETDQDEPTPRGPVDAASSDDPNNNRPTTD